jgi:hypothetical protein
MKFLWGWPFRLLFRTEAARPKGFFVFGHEALLTIPPKHDTKKKLIPEKSSWEPA